MWRDAIVVMRFRAALATVLFAAMLLAGSGCVGHRPPATGWLRPTPPQRSELGTVAVVAAAPDQTVEIEISGRPPNRIAATLLGATTGAAVPVIVGVGVGLSSGPLFLLPVAAGALLAPAGLAVGTVAGLRTPGTSIWDTQEKLARMALTPGTIHDLLRDRVTAMVSMQTLQTVEAVSERHADTRLEVGVTKLALAGQVHPLFQRPREGSLLALRLRARARLIRTADGVELYANEFGYSGRELRLLGDWASDDATALQQELDRAYAVAAEKIVAELLFPDRHARAIDEESSDIEVPGAVRQGMARELDALRDRGLLPEDIQIRFRFIRYDPGRRFMLFMRIHRWIGLQARVLDRSGQEIGRVETEDGTGEVLYPDPVKTALQRIALNIAAHARSIAPPGP